VITATRPRTTSTGASAIRVRGDCGHEWTATTTKASLIHAGVTDLPGLTRRVRLYCPECAKEHGKEWAHHHVQPVVAVQPFGDGIRYCSSGHHRVRLRRGHGPLCGACEVAEAKKAAEEAAAEAREAEGRIVRAVGE
jgi:hypothetical protein